LARWLNDLAAFIQIDSDGKVRPEDFCEDEDVTKVLCTEIWRL